MKKILSNILISKEQSKDSGLFSFKTLSEKFFWSLKWNGIESILYHIIFIVHQWYMFSLADKQLYGIMGTFFACSYLGVTILMGALDVAIMPWIVPCTKNKPLFASFIKKQILPQIGIYFLTPFFLWLFFKQSWIPASFYILKIHMLIMGIFIACEGIKKLLRHVLQLMFMNRSTALLEIGGIFLYCSIVWTRYFLGYSFSLYGLIIPFIISSLISIGGILFAMYYFYTELPFTTSDDKDFELPTWKQIGYVRTIVSFNQIVRSLFSTNILIPISSTFFGFVQTGTISFINYVSHTFTFFIYKICAPSAAAFFGRVTNSSHNDQFKAFHLVMKTIGVVIILTTCIACITGVYGSSHLTFSIATILIGFLVIHTVENIFIMYEKFLIIRNQTELLALLNAINLIISYLLLQSSLSLITAGILCFIIRLVVFAIVTFTLFMVNK